MITNKKIYLCESRYYEDKGIPLTFHEAFSSLLHFFAEDSHDYRIEEIFEVIKEKIENFINLINISDNQIVYITEEDEELYYMIYTGLGYQYEKETSYKR